ncbi:chloride channel protein [Anatilimnocola floriformis]|uniref:chloride channel protein n=1 Tax=Anatilimnocola floriformis TaxID=2948575 RepID=UPI0020C39904|nr:chloride channel protein [Anatilimnocola floriformis]
MANKAKQAKKTNQHQSNNGEAAQEPPVRLVVDARLMQLCCWAVGLGITAAIAAQILLLLIAFFTNLAFFQRFSFITVSPADNQMGWWVLVPPIIGAFIIGLMARYGSSAIRGHGIPEAMEQVLTNESRIPARMTWLKPLSAAISIGTGGPFGSEGPIIATGSALGSLLGQLIRTTAGERKTLLAAGAAAGMAATFGAPVSAVLLAIELLLFEFRPRSLIPVALASVTAAAVRIGIEGADPVFPMPDLATPTAVAILVYVAIGALMGVMAAAITKITYAIEDAFEHLPIHWMWWPMIGALAIGGVGYFAPRTLGVGYANISDALNGNFAMQAAIFLVGMKFISWSVSLGSGTSGGTLAPLFTVGAGLGLVIGQFLNSIFPAAGIDPRVAALVGMAALFAGASRALLASAVFAFETTLQPLGLLPLLGGCGMSYLLASLLCRNSLLTEKIARRGVHAPVEYLTDHLDQVAVGSIASKQVVTLRAQQTLAEVRKWLDSDPEHSQHQGYPVVDERMRLIGVLTRRNLLAATEAADTPLRNLVTRFPIYVYDTSTARDAADHMVRHDVGRLPVVSRANPKLLVGIVTRSDILSVYERRLRETESIHPREHWQRSA